ncbi:MAG: VCBS repeat-containing protein [Parcubacteria group bacterium Gr01-1014_66]|nr:MAG: VCBS repeat-containing protein [Parcubacteria group bacterium Gr01-1014_66]
MVYSIDKRKILFFSASMALVIVSLLLTQLVFADVTGNRLPSSDGAYLQWTPKTGTTHYTMVDETACNGTTDYNSTNTIGSRDSYGISLLPIPNGSTITGIEVTPCASRNANGNGSATMNVFYRFNGIDSADAGNYALTGTTPTPLVATAFTGLALVKGSGSALQIGAVLSAGTKGARLSHIAVVITYTRLIAPSALGAVNISGSHNDLSWTDNSSYEDGFVIQRSINNQLGPFSEIATTAASIVAYSDTDLAADQTYYYRVRAFNSGGSSGYSNTAHAITATIVPLDPSGLGAIASSSSAILNWNDNAANEEGVSIERSTDNVNFTEIATVGINAISHTDSGLAPGTYYWRVRAFNAIGNSGYSNTADTTIP